MYEFRLIQILVDVIFYIFTLTISSLSLYTDFNFSFGQSAIFLIGGESENNEPTPLFLHSGDIVVMSKESRLSYHAVPKIINTTDLPYEMNKQDVLEFVKNKKEHFSYNVQNNEFWAPFNNYLSHSRININVRQVLHHNQKTLDDNR